MSNNIQDTSINPMSAVTSNVFGTITGNIFTPNNLSYSGLAAGSNVKLDVQDSLRIGDVVIPYKDIAEAINSYKMCMSKIELLEEKIDYLEKLEEERGNLPRKRT